MLLRFGRHGEFLACSNYPTCKTTREPGAPTAVAEAPACPECNAEMVLKRSRFGPFWACSRYPDCKGTRRIVTGATSPNTPSGVKCPECGEGEIIEKRSRRGRAFWGCNRYPACKFTLPARPVPHPCPTCGAPFVLERKSVKKGTTWSCAREGCDFKGPAEDA
jgi:DNA topoisomerase-1